MDISLLQMVLVFIVAFLAGIESRIEEFQFHQPLVACTLIGLVLGDLPTGILVGATLQITALGWMNIGAAVAPDAAMASIVSTLIVIVGKQNVGTGIALAIPLAAAGQVLTIISCTITVGIQHAADRSAKDGNLARITYLHLGALFLPGLKVAIPAIIVAASVGTNIVQDALGSIPDVITGGLDVAGGIIVVVGYAMVINMMRAPNLMMFFFVGFVVAAFTDFNLVALGVLGAAMAFFYLQLHPKYYRGVDGGKTAKVHTNTLDNQLD